MTTSKLLIDPNSLGIGNTRYFQFDMKLSILPSILSIQYLFWYQ